MSFLVIFTRYEHEAHYYTIVLNGIAPDYNAFPNILLTSSVQIRMLQQVKFPFSVYYFHFKEVVYELVH